MAPSNLTIEQLQALVDDARYAISDNSEFGSVTSSSENESLHSTNTSASDHEQAVYNAQGLRASSAHRSGDADRGALGTAASCRSTYPRAVPSQFRPTRPSRMDQASASSSGTSSSFESTSSDDEVPDRQAHRYHSGPYLDTRARGAGASGVPHRQAKLQSVLLLVIQQILSVPYRQEPELSPDADSRGCAVEDRADYRDTSSRRTLVKGKKGGSGGSGLVYPDVQSPWAGLASSLPSLLKLYGKHPIGGNDVKTRSGAGRAVAERKSDVELACVRCLDLIRHLLNSRLVPLANDKTYTRSLSRGEARASTIVTKTISTSPLSTSGLDSHDHPYHARLSRIVDYVPDVIILRFAQCALHTPSSATTIIRDGRTARRAGGTLNLGHLDRGMSSNTSKRFLHDLNWGGLAGAVGLDVANIGRLILRGNTMDASDLAFLPALPFPSIHTIDISHQPISHIPLSWLLSGPSECHRTETSIQSDTSGPHAGKCTPSMATRDLQVRQVRIKMRKTAQYREAADEDVLDLDELDFGDLQRAVEYTNTRSRVIGRVNGDRVIRREGKGVESLVEMAALIAAAQLRAYESDNPAREHRTRFDGPIDPSRPGTVPMSPTGTIHEHQPDLDPASVSPFDSLPPHSYELITTAFTCDICLVVSFPGLGPRSSGPGINSAPMDREGDDWKGGVVFAYPADTRHASTSRPRKRTQTQIRTRTGAGTGVGETRGQRELVAERIVVRGTVCMACLERMMIQPVVSRVVGTHRLI